jgi:hypothetical protein
VNTNPAAIDAGVPTNTGSPTAAPVTVMSDESAVVLAEREVKSIVEEALSTEVSVAPVPPMKPLVDATGPENDDLAIMISSHVRFAAYLSTCRQPGLSDMPDNPGMMPIYTTGYKRKGEPKLPFFS